MTMQLLRRSFREDDYKWDPWGTATSHLFAVCDVLSVVDSSAIPAKWGFSHGAYRDPSLEDYAEDDGEVYPFATRCYAEDYLAGETTVADLVKWGNVLNRYLELAHRNGRDY